MATKRQIAIAEHWIKKETKRLMKEAPLKSAPNIDTKRMSQVRSKNEGTTRIIDSIVNACQNFKKDRGGDINDLVNFINTQLKTLKRL